MALHQGLEGCFLVVCHKPIEQFRVQHFAGTAQNNHAAEAVDELA
jgi:hypothetical protein